MNFSRLVITAALLISFASCGPKNELKPLYPTGSLKVPPITVSLWSDIGYTVIPTTPPHNWVRKLFGWLPGVAEIFELPLDLTVSLLPPIKFPDLYENLPTDGWYDPQLLSRVKSIKLAHGFLRVLPDEERAPEHRSRRCWPAIWKKCDEAFNFLEEARVYLIFKGRREQSNPESRREVREQEEILEAESQLMSQMDDPKDDGPSVQQPPLDPDLPAEKVEVLLGRATKENDYDVASKSLYFRATQLNLKPYLDVYGEFQIRVFTKGRFPKMAVPITGRVLAEIVMDL